MRVELNDLKHCPYCKKESPELNIGNGNAYIICSDHNCLGEMNVQWGTEDKPYIFIQKMKDNWNKRTK